MNKLIFSSVLAIALVGCSSKALYKAGQDYQKSVCVNEAASPEQHQACINAERKSYEEYEEEKAKVEK